MGKSAKEFLLSILAFVLSYILCHLTFALAVDVINIITKIPFAITILSFPAGPELYAFSGIAAMVLIPFYYFQDIYMNKLKHGHWGFILFSVFMILQNIYTLFNSVNLYGVFNYPNLCYILLIFGFIYSAFNKH